MKKTNKGFSLVELIIVIAIMAILAGAIAPALIKYIDKSRKSNDVSSAKTIKTAIETALGTESVYEWMVNTKGSTIVIFPGKGCSSLSTYSGITSAIKVTSLDTTTSGAVTDSSGKAVTAEQCASLIGSNIGETTPKVKYKKSTKVDTTDVTPTNFYAYVNAKGTVEVGLIGADTVTVSDAGKVSSAIQLAPTINDDYQ
jgi:prepilin-type N-terminal cleavage/methylation domain-containing protein